MNEQMRDNRNGSLLLPVAAACLALLFFAPMVTDGGAVDFNLLGMAFKITLCGAVSAWLFQKVGWLLGSLSTIPVLLASYFLSGGSPYLIAASLLYLPFGITLALVSADKLSRSTAIAIGTGVGAVATLSLLLIPTYLGQGSLSLSALQAQYASFFSFLQDNIKASFVISVLENNVSFVTAENVAFYTKQVLSLFPSLIVMAFIVMGYLSSWIYKLILQFNRDELPDRKAWTIAPAPVSAAFLILGVAIFLIDNPLPPYIQIGLVSPGLFVLPGFCISGFFGSFGLRIVNGLPSPRILRPLLLFVAGLSTGFPGLLILTAIFGVFDCLREAWPRKRN